MSKGDRVRAIHAEEAPKLKVKLEINMMEDGKVTVSGPIADPVFATSLISQGLNSLAQYWAQQREEASRIVKPATNLILPRG